MRIIFLAVILLLASCSVTVKSSQINTIKSLFDSSKAEALSRLWGLEYQGKYYEAYAASKEGLVRFYILGQIEIDFDTLFVTRIESFGLPKRQVFISDVTSTTKLINVDGVELMVKCDPIAQGEDFEYVQHCRNDDIAWHFSNTFKLNNAREIIYIKAYYSPRELPLVMWLNQSTSLK